MSAYSTPKVFVSYSWTSPEHEQWVLDLCHNLNDDGIEVLLDKWDLQAGGEANTFMERMVNDKTVSKIIMIIDQAYTDKANSRIGGVGTESTILSNEIYSKKELNNIVAVIAESGATKPTFYSSRIHIDLSKQENYANEYEDLIRWAFDKYKHVRPKAIGKPPSFITQDDSIETLHTNTEYRIAIDALEKGKQNASGAIKCYLNKLNEELIKFRLNSKEVKGDVKITEAYKKNIKNFQPYLFELKKIAESYCSHSNDSKVIKHFCHFFENFLKLHLTYTTDGTSFFQANFEQYKFIAHQSFLSIIAILLKYDCFNEVSDILDEQFIIPENYIFNNNANHETFTIFNGSNLTIIPFGLKQREQSPIGAMLKELHDNEVISFKELIEADVFLYLKSMINILKNNKTNKWWPHTSIYMGHKIVPLRMFLKSEKQSYYDEVKKTLGCEDLHFIYNILTDDPWKNPNVPAWIQAGFVLDLVKVTNIDKLEVKYATDLSSMGSIF